MDILCNGCGYSCALTSGTRTELGGLLMARVCGGYFSTPGNGCGALDDATAYSFSLCEFCLDWLFAQFKIPVATTNYMEGDAPDAPWKPAEARVAVDGWRKMKGKFAVEAALRATTRGGSKG
jgi:hypothetical protein